MHSPKDSGASPANSTRAFCIGHQPPVFEPATAFTMVSPVAFGMDDELVIEDDRFGPGFHGSVLSEYTQLFGLADYLEGLAAQPEALYLFQYRKFVTRQAGSRRSSNLPHAYASDREEAYSLFPRFDEPGASSGRLLTVPALKVERSLAVQYSKHHLVEDFVTFAVACSLSGAFDPARIARFVNCPILFPSPALCLIPTPVFLDMMRTLRLVWERFAPNFLEKRDGYQRRVGGFLLERLHSYLLLEQVTSQQANGMIVGNLVVVSESDVVHPTL